TDAVDSPRSVYAADLDGDGDADVLSASAFDDRIAWYRNTGGSFSTGTDIASPAKGNRADFASAVYAVDLDGDGDIDVLSASESDDRIVWYENTDGNGAFSTGTEIASPAKGNPADVARAVYAVDLDGDGDPDVLSASVADDRIVWYENLAVVAQ
ncbi:MAG: FG-GAP repeat domain-containing protein, partial [Spirochaetaceae bacterium]